MSCRNARKTNRNPEQRDHGGPLTFFDVPDQPAQVDERVGQKPARGVSLTAAFGYLTPVQGALIQEAIDVAVILNALRALSPGPSEREQT